MSSNYVALRALYEATNGALWRDTYTNGTSFPGNVGWLSGSDVCSWQWVVCADGRVTELELYSNHLVGTLPSQLALLSNLRHFRAAGAANRGRISGTIPQNMSSLLATLELGGNQLSGTIPSTLRAPFVSFNVGINSISGTLPSALIDDDLTEFTVGTNAISGFLPTELGRPRSLSFLGISYSRFSGTMPTQIGRATSLRTLYAGDNHAISGVLPSQLGHLTLIETMWIDTNKLSGTLPPSVGGLTRLSALGFGPNPRLSGYLPSEFGLLTAITQLRANACAFSGTLPSEFGQLAKVNDLFLYANSLSGMLPSQLGLTHPDVCFLTQKQCYRLDACGITAGTIGVLIALSICYCLIIESRRASKRTEDELLIQLGELRKNDFMDVRVDGADEPVELRAYLIEAMTELGMAPIDDTPRGSGPQAQQSVRPQQSVRHPQQSDFDAAVMDAVPLGSYWRIARAGLTNRLASMKASMKASPKASSKASAGSSGARRGSGVMPILTEHGVTTKAGESVAEGSSSGEADEQTRFACSSLEELVLGEPADAALGVAHLMRASPAAVRAGMLRGVREVEAEFEAFCAIARTAQLEEAHVAALRIYTTGAFKVLNGPLRHPWGGSPHPFPVTVSFLSDAIGKLRAVGAIQPSALSEFDLWRGVKDRMTTADFAQRGGTEPAPMSTTSNLKVALKYTIDATARPHGGGHALLFKLRTDSFMGRGASLTWVSAFPGEEETVFPPLTYMKTSNKAAHEAVACADGLVVTVMEVNAYLGAA